MRLTIDSEAHAAYLTVRGSDVVRTREVDPSLIVDYGADGQIVGIEILGVPEIERLPMRDISMEADDD